MPITDLYQSYGIETAPEGHKHSRRGWVNIACPHCNGTGYHLGFNITANYFFCFKCGSHQIENTLIKLLKIPYNQAKDLTKSYKLGKRSFAVDEKNGVKTLVKVGGKPFKYPSEVAALQTPHKRYIEKRGFNVEEITELWGVMGTSPTSVLKTGDQRIPYGYRILIPIQWEDKVVTYQCRDFSGKQELKYMACPEVREIIHHKHILYGHPTLWKKRRAILAEGAIDVWRLGVNACATLGTGYTPQQMRLLCKLFDELVIMFDPEPVAQQVAKKLGEELSFRGVKTTLYTNIKTDPGDLSPESVKRILKELNFL